MAPSGWGSFAQSVERQWLGAVWWRGALVPRFLQNPFSMTSTRVAMLAGDPTFGRQEHGSAVRPWSSGVAPGQQSGAVTMCGICGSFTDGWRTERTSARVSRMAATMDGGTETPVHVDEEHWADALRRCRVFVFAFWDERRRLCVARDPGGCQAARCISPLGVAASSCAVATSWLFPSGFCKAFPAEAWKTKWFPTWRIRTGSASAIYHRGLQRRLAGGDN
jgi:hypothetical protein